VDTRLDRKVAIKISRQQFSARFMREARAISALNHPHICTLYDVGTDYLVTEFVEGQTLRESMACGLQHDRVLEIARQVLEALHAAHAAGIVHRDLKPANIMVRFDGYADTNRLIRQQIRQRNRIARQRSGHVPLMDFLDSGQVVSASGVAPGRPTASSATLQR
jgi:serine/threonine protein kinase